MFKDKTIMHLARCDGVTWQNTAGACARQFTPHMSSLVNITVAHCLALTPLSLDEHILGSTAK